MVSEIDILNIDPAEEQPQIPVENEDLDVLESPPGANTEILSRINSHEVDESYPALIGLRRAVLAGRIAWNKEKKTGIEEADSSYKSSAEVQLRGANRFNTDEEMANNPKLIELIQSVHSLQPHKNPDVVRPITRRERVAHGIREGQNEKNIKQRAQINRLSVLYKGYGDILENPEALARVLDSRIPGKEKRAIRKAARLYGQKTGKVERRTEKIERAAGGDTLLAQRRSDKYHNADTKVSEMSGRLDELRQIQSEARARDNFISMFTYSDVLKKKHQNKRELLESSVAPKYAAALRRLAEEYGMEDINDTAEQMVGFTVEHLQKIGIKFTPHAYSKSWAYWNMAREKYFHDDSGAEIDEETKQTYEGDRLDPLADTDASNMARQDMIFHQVGWQILGAHIRGELGPVHPEAAEILKKFELNQKAKETRMLKHELLSYEDLVKLGQAIEPNHSPEAPSTEKARLAPGTEVNVRGPQGGGEGHIVSLAGEKDGISYYWVAFPPDGQVSSVSGKDIFRDLDSNDSIG